MKRNLLLTALAGAVTVASLAASPAQAGPIYYQKHGLGIGGLHFEAPVSFTGFAGQLIFDRGAAGPDDDFAVYCVDLMRPKTAVQDVVARPLSQLPDNGNPSSVQPDAGARVAWLLNQYGTDAWLATDGNNRAAALQLAIWEVLYDPLGSYHIGNGSFVLAYWRLPDYAPFVSYTTDYLLALGTNRSEAIWYDVTLKGVNGQDFAQAASVPEPGSTMMLLASGLSALQWFARRRPNL